MDISDGEGEWRWKPVTACVRLNASIGEREVVWGDRLDPARMMVLNVPLPESGRRFREIILHDGAPNGQRTLDGVDVPVFDELQLWRPSEYSTFEVVLEGMDEDAERGLTEICTSRKMGLEDWSTVRFLCAECSTGNPGPHECKVNYQQSDISHWAIAAITEDDVRSAIHELAQQAEVRCVSIALVLKAEPNAAN